MEIFRRNNVRFIAVNNGIDSEKPDTLEFAPFINIMSEWYARDISKKVKTGINTKGQGKSQKPECIPPANHNTRLEQIDKVLNKLMPTTHWARMNKTVASRPKRRNGGRQGAQLAGKSK